VEFRILGPLEVLEDGRPIALGRLKERVVLAVLLLHANEFVSRDRLIDELWGVAPPATARKAVNVYISKLRKTLGGNGHDPIATADGGYRLAVDPDLLDADRMRSLLASARERMAGGESETASRLLQEALAFWRGPTLAGLALESVGRDEVAQLDELRLTILMDRIDCDLAQGRHEHVLGELQVLVREHPLRERLRAQQMLALYRADRQADALDAYQQARHDLMDELGIEPSESLRRLQQGILRHDPVLEAPAGTAAANGAAPAPVPAEEYVPAVLPARARPRRLALHRRYLAVAGLAAVAAVAALAVFLTTRGGGARPPSSPVSSVSPNSVASLDPATGEVSDYAGGLKPGPMALVGETLWTVERGNATIGRYDLRARHGMPPLQPGPALDDIAVDAEGHAWVSDRKPVVTWIGHVADGTGPYETPVVSTERIPVPLPGAGAEAVGAGYLWVISDLPGRTGESVSLIDVRHRRLASTIPLGRQTTAIAYGYGSAWIGAYDPQHSTAWLLRVRPGSDQIESLELESQDGAGPLAVAVGDGGVWVLTSRSNLLRIDPRTRQIVHRIAMSAQQPDLLAVGAGSVWTANHNGYSVSQIDPHKNEIVRTIPLGRYSAVPCGITATHGAVFVSFGETTCS
jgi:DNA-binding SARP family transcriptional activator/streptogramin lyase